MADLFNLDAELVADEEPDPENLLQDPGQQDDEQQERDDEEWNNIDREDAEQVDVFQPTAAGEEEPTTPGGAFTASAGSTQPHRSSLPDRVDLEDIAAAATTDDLDYTKLYSFWRQETQSPELLPFPAMLVDRVKERIVAATDNDDDPVETGNEGLDALLASLLTIDTDRVTFLLADLLKRRLRKIEAHPFYMETKQDRMSPDEQSFWEDYRALVQQHLHQTVTQHFPDRENWRDIVHGEPDLDHTYCFAYCVEDVSLDHGQDGIQPQAAGNRIIARYDKVKDHIQRGSMLLI